DGKRDLAGANASSNNVSVLLGNGSGTFGTATNFAAGTLPRSVAIADLNGDGKLDLAVANQTSANVSVLLGNGDGTFGAAINFAAGVDPRSVAIGDLDGVGGLALAVATQPPANVAVLLNSGTNMSTFQLTPTAVTAVNDAPMNTVPGTQSVAEDTTLPIAGVSVADIDSSALTTTLSVANGILNVTAGPGVAGNGTASVTITGTAVHVNPHPAGPPYTRHLHLPAADTPQFAP